jgi:hypothetical protein
MLSAKELENCINLLADINVMTDDNRIKQKLLEIGYQLKKELDNVSLIENMSREADARSRNMNSTDVKRLLEDNIQLFNEKEHVLKQNQELKNIIEGKIKAYDTKLNMLSQRVGDVADGLGHLLGLR